MKLRHSDCDHGQRSHKSLQENDGSMSPGLASISFSMVFCPIIYETSVACTKEVLSGFAWLVESRKAQYAAAESEWVEMPLGAVTSY